ncbi:MAG: hypothetical protein B6240_09635 [Desulfobacteraceae bacterium 4572_87]|nr:MAG: hypothetical protein B6240_09635 [Desulfobacteraceae bacterium 4572_87]
MFSPLHVPELRDKNCEKSTVCEKNIYLTDGVKYIWLNISKGFGMKSRQKGEYPWKYATFEGVARLQYRQTAKMTLSERLQALDDMIHLAGSLHMGGKRSRAGKKLTPEQDSSD